MNDSKTEDSAIEQPQAQIPEPELRTEEPAAAAGDEAEITQAPTSMLIPLRVLVPQLSEIVVSTPPEFFDSCWISLEITKNAETGQNDLVVQRMIDTDKLEAFQEVMKARAAESLILQSSAAPEPGKNAE